jgi:hypothetical protein
MSIVHKPLLPSARPTIGLGRGFRRLADRA